MLSIWSKKSGMWQFLSMLWQLATYITMTFVTMAGADPNVCISNEHSITAWFDGGSYQPQTRIWFDKSSSGHHATIGGTVHYFEGDNASDPLYLNGQPSVFGDTSTSIRFGTVLNVNAEHAVFNLCKYNGPAQGRILQATTNTFMGHSNGKSGVAMEAGSSITASLNRFSDNWVLSAQQSSFYRGNGVDLTSAPRTPTSVGQLSINGGLYSTESSDFGCAELLIFNDQTLDSDEIECIEQYFSDKYDLGFSGLGQWLPYKNGCYGTCTATVLIAPTASEAHISQLCLRHSTGLDALLLVEWSDGERHNELHGQVKSSGTSECTPLLADDECYVQIIVHASGERVNGLELLTNLGHTHGVYGVNSGTSSTVQGNNRTCLSQIAVHVNDTILGIRFYFSASMLTLNEDHSNISTSLAFMTSFITSSAWHTTTSAAATAGNDSTARDDAFWQLDNEVWMIVAGVCVAISCVFAAVLVVRTLKHRRLLKQVHDMQQVESVPLQSQSQNQSSLLQSYSNRVHHPQGSSMPGSDVFDEYKLETEPEREDSTIITPGAPMIITPGAPGHGPRMVSLPARPNAQRNDGPELGERQRTCTQSSANESLYNSMLGKEGQDGCQDVEAGQTMAILPDELEEDEDEEEEKEQEQQETPLH